MRRTEWRPDLAARRDALTADPGSAGTWRAAAAARSRHNKLAHIGIIAPLSALWPELLAIICFLLLPWIGIAVALHHEAIRARVAAEASTASLAQALEESTRRTVGQLDYLLLSARAMRAVQGDRFDFQSWVHTQTLPDQMTAQIAIADRNGFVVESTSPLIPGVNVSDRPHFRAQTDPAHDTLYISEPVIGRVSGVETVQFSRKLLAPDGSFDGIVVLSLGSQQLSQFYTSLKLGNGFISIVAPEGVVLARGPTFPGLVGSSVARNPVAKRLLNEVAGALVLPANAAHSDVIASFRRLHDYPLIVTVAIDTNTVFEPYRTMRTNASITGGAISLAVCLIGFFWIRQKLSSLASRRALNVTLDTISQGILMVDGHGRIPVINPRVLDLLGHAGETPAQTRNFVASRASALVASQIATAEATPHRGYGPGHRLRQESKFETQLDNGAIIEVHTHALREGGFVQTYTDITEQRLAHAQVFHLAHHDTLTGLANRAALMQRIASIVDQDLAVGDLTALVIIDLDGFKSINDTMGHDAGDALLVEVAGRLRGLIRGSDLVARLGGDEFVLLIPNLRGRDDIIPLAERLLRRLAEPARILGQHVRVGASLGIAFHPQDGLDVDTWFKHADMALYSAKKGGRGVYHCFNEQLSQAVSEHHRLEGDLRRALDGGELEVHFQPKFDCKSLDVVGFEALARWRHPSRGYVSPAVFIRIAEDCGLIGRLGKWVLEEACKCVATWEPRYPVAVNVSVMQLRDGGLKDQIADALTSTGLLPQHLEIEVTESVLADDDQTVLDNLRAIKALGIPIALDDFGTGYSSLSYLRRFSFDTVKIDRSFVQGQAEDPGMRVILEAILGMCHKLGLSTIGEGIETQAQLDVLHDLGCTEVQGYLLGRPMPRDKIMEFTASRRQSPDDIARTATALAS